IAVSSQVAGRDRVELEPLIGLLMKTLVLRTDLSGDPPFTKLMERVRDTVLEAVAHQNLPLDRNRNPLLQVNFGLQQDFVKPQRFARLTLSAIPSKSPGAIHELNFLMVERADGWRASCEYNTDLYEAATIRGLLERFERLLESVTENPGRRLSELSL